MRPHLITAGLAGLAAAIGASASAAPCLIAPEPAAGATHSVTPPDMAKSRAHHRPGAAACATTPPSAQAKQYGPKPPPKIMTPQRDDR